LGVLPIKSWSDEVLAWSLQQGANHLRMVQLHAAEHIDVKKRFFTFFILVTFLTFFIFHTFFKNVENLLSLQANSEI